MRENLLRQGSLENKKEHHLVLVLIEAVVATVREESVAFKDQQGKMSLGMMWKQNLQ